MVAELILRVAADPNALKSLSTEELIELLTEPEPPRWAFLEAARGSYDEQVMAYLFTHPHVPPNLLRQAVGHKPARFERFLHHVAVCSEPRPTIKAVLCWVVPESAHVQLSPSRQKLLVETLSAPCLLKLSTLVTHSAARAILDARLKTELGERAFHMPYSAKQKPPRSYAWTAQFLLLGDFLHYLTLKDVPETHELPVLARVALALNTHQPLKPHLADADVRVRLAAEERKDGT